MYMAKVKLLASQGNLNVDLCLMSVLCHFETAIKVGYIEALYSQPFPAYMAFKCAINNVISNCKKSKCLWAQFEKHVI